MKGIRTLISDAYKVISNQFFLGIILGGITAFLANYATVQYQNYLEFETYKSSLYQELRHNSDLIEEGIKQNKSYRGIFDTDVWDSGLATGKIYQLNGNLISSLKSIYSDIKRTNMLRIIQTERTIQDTLDSSKPASLVDFYTEQLKANSLTAQQRQDFTSKLHQANKDLEDGLQIADWESKFMDQTFNNQNLELKKEFDPLEKSLGI